jgi:predicted transcriptional regulator
MKKTKTFTIEDDIYKKFNELAKKKSINKSLFIENALKDYIEKEENKQEYVNNR